MRIFHKPEDYQAFVDLLLLARRRIMAVDVLSLCLQPNHWPLVLRPQGDGDLAVFMRWLSTAHVRRHHAHYHSAAGHLYQGRYKSCDCLASCLACV
jgi:putative transposase